MPLWDYIHVTEQQTFPITSQTKGAKVSKTSQLVGNIIYFVANENGHKLSLGKLIARKYKWIAKTKFNRKTYKKFGIFIVEDSALKKKRNCRQSSCYETSRGIIKREILSFEIIDKIWNRGDITIISFEETNFSAVSDVVMFNSQVIDWTSKQY